MNIYVYNICIYAGRMYIKYYQYLSLYSEITGGFLIFFNSMFLKFSPSSIWYIYSKKKRINYSKSLPPSWYKKFLMSPKDSGLANSCIMYFNNFPKPYTLFLENSVFLNYKKLF